jgi:hypothetical protein
VTPTAQATTGTGRIAATMLESLGQHRMLLTRQAHQLHAPGASRQWVHRKLARLRTAGLVEGTKAPAGRLLWHLTESGVRALDPASDHAGHRALAPEEAAGPLQEHTLAVNDVGIAFVRAAGEREDECGPFDWRHEVAHSLGPPPGRRMPEQLIADAVLTYQLRDPDGATSILYRFVELDRANRSAADLTRRLGRYARLYRRLVPVEESSAGESAPLWSRLYPVFPTVLVVLAGRPRDRLEERRRTVLALCRQDPDLAETPEVEVSVCLLEDLARRGPFAPICRTLAAPGKPVDWLGEEVG